MNYLWYRVNLKSVYTSMIKTASSFELNCKLHDIVHADFLPTRSAAAAAAFPPTFFAMQWKKNRNWICLIVHTVINNVCHVLHTVKQINWIFLKLLFQTEFNKYNLPKSKIQACGFSIKNYRNNQIHKIRREKCSKMRMGLQKGME